MPEDPIILFVCEHGAAKSVLAAAYFNRLAEEQGLEIRAMARGTNPYLEISEQIIRGLSQDGLAPTEPAPRKLSLEDTRTAYLVSFCELSAEYTQGAIVEQWDGIPAVSENYEWARDAIVERLHQLVSKLRRSS
jgi:arsenate reductase